MYIQVSVIAFLRLLTSSSKVLLNDKRLETYFFDLYESKAVGMQE